MEMRCTTARKRARFSRKPASSPVDGRPDLPLWPIVTQRRGDFLRPPNSPPRCYRCPDERRSSRSSAVSTFPQAPRISRRSRRPAHWPSARSRSTSSRCGRCSSRCFCCSRTFSEHCWLQSLRPCEAGRAPRRVGPNAQKRSSRAAARAFDWPVNLAGLSRCGKQPDVAVSSAAKDRDNTGETRSPRVGPEAAYSSDTRLDGLVPA